MSPIIFKKAKYRLGRYGGLSALFKINEVADKDTTHT